MSLLWNPYAAMALLVALISAAAAWWLWRLQPGAPANRRIAVMLGLDAAWIGTFSIQYATTAAAVAFAAQVVGDAALAMLPFAYLRIVALLDTPLSRRLRRRAVDRGLVGMQFLAAGAVVAFRGFFLQGLTRQEYAQFEQVPGPGFYSLVIMLMLASLIGLGVAIAAWRRSKGAARAHNLGFVFAFGTRDALYLIGGPILFLAPADSSWMAILFGAIWPVIVELAFVVVLTYAVVRFQVLDVELRLKFTIRQSTLLAVFVAMFFVASEGFALLVGDRTGNEWVGILAAGILLFFMSPLQRMADRISHAALPDVRDTPTYRQRRRVEIYEAAYRAALLDGTVSERERDVLAALQDKLALSATEARSIERSATS